MTASHSSTATSAVDASDTIIELRNASVTYDDGDSYVLDDVSIDIERNEIIGIVGESGSGKSMLASALLDAIPDPGLLSGEVSYYPDGGDRVDVLDLDAASLKELRWEEISMVFQGAMSSFNPTMKIGGHFKETLKALYLDPERVLDSYPHELSGGMQQRALIALSLVLEPDVLVMDEPTAALDLLMQRSILVLLEKLQEKYDLTMVFITHDLPLVASLADRLAVMYAFELVEVGPTEEILGHASHPYTRALLNATPNLDAPLEEMEAIEGSSPAPINVPEGCSFRPRCPLADESCRVDAPEDSTVVDDHTVACHHWEDSADEIPLNYAPDGGTPPGVDATGSTPDGGDADGARGGSADE